MHGLQGVQNSAGVARWGRGTVWKVAGAPVGGGGGRGGIRAPLHGHVTHLGVTTQAPPPPHLPPQRGSRSELEPHCRRMGGTPGDAWRHFHRR